MNEVIILGASGMLGNAVTKQFITAGYKPILTSRRSSYDLTCAKFPLRPIYSFELDAETPPNWRLIKEGYYVINCIGVIKPFVEKVGPANTIYINSVFPHLLANHCEKVGAKLIHITTDCVFSGEFGPYDEYDKHDATDLYGQSKSLGEPKNAMVIRTSIIGEEIHKDASLIAWVKSQRGNTVRGFSDHIWNGITTKQYGKICVQIIENDLWEPSLTHVFSPQQVTKYELLQMLNGKFNLNLTIDKVQSGSYTNRALKSVSDICNQLHIPSLPQQIQEM